MENKQDIGVKENEVHYQKPLFKKEEQMTFPTEIMEKFNHGRFCLQCSGCHGCR
jgi:hypothetical protein